MGAAAAALTVVSMPVVHAHPDYDYRGGCEAVSYHDGTAWRTRLVLAVVAVDYSGTPAPLTPINGSCVVYRDGVYQGEAPVGSGVGVAVGATNAFAMTPDHVWTVCDVVYVGGEVHTTCRDATLFVDPAESVGDVVGALDGVVEDACALLPQITEEPLLEITDDGDVYVNGELVLDCDGLLG